MTWQSGRVGNKHGDQRRRRIAIYLNVKKNEKAQKYWSEREKKKEANLLKHGGLVFTQLGLQLINIHGHFL